VFAGGGKEQGKAHRAKRLQGLCWQLVPSLGQVPLACGALCQTEPLQGHSLGSLVPNQPLLVIVPAGRSQCHSRRDVLPLSPPFVPPLTRPALTHPVMSCFFFFFPWDWDLNSGLCTCQAGNLLLESQLQSFCSVIFCLFVLFLRWDLENYLPRLASNCNPPDLSLPSS
jgi:hypothetical protein